MKKINIYLINLFYWWVSILSYFATFKCLYFVSNHIESNLFPINLHKNLNEMFEIYTLDLIVLISLLLTTYSICSSKYSQSLHKIATSMPFHFILPRILVIVLSLAQISDSLDLFPSQWRFNVINPTEFFLLLTLIIGLSPLRIYIRNFRDKLLTDFEEQS
jgi:hypothetical protein